MQETVSFEQRLLVFSEKFIKFFIRVSSTFLAWVATGAQCAAEISSLAKGNEVSVTFWVIGGFASITSGLAGLGLQKRIKALSDKVDALETENLSYEIDMEFLLENMGKILEGSIIQIIHDLNLSDQCRICILRFEGRNGDDIPEFIQLANFSLTEGNCFFEKEILYKGTIMQAWENGEYFFELADYALDRPTWKAIVKQSRTQMNGQSINHYKKRNYFPAAEYGFRLSSDDHPIGILYFESKVAGELDARIIRDYIEKQKSHLLRLLQSTKSYYPENLLYARDSGL